MQSTEHIAPIVGRAINHAALRPRARRLECTTAEYHADPCERPSLNQSVATVLVNESPKHAYYAHPRLGGAPVEAEDETEGLKLGSLVNELLLEDGRQIEIVEAKDWRTKAAKEARARATKAGATAVLPHQYERAKAVAAEVKQSIAGYGLRLSGPGFEREVKVEWTESGEGYSDVLCRGMIDGIDHGASLIVDLKTGYQTNPADLWRKVLDFGYDIQATAYLSAVNNLWPERAGRWRFLFLFVESKPPFDVVPLEADGSLLEVGHHRWTGALREWSRCTETGVWPGYVPGNEPGRLSIPERVAQRILEGES